MANNNNNHTFLMLVFFRTRGETGSLCWKCEDTNTHQGKRLDMNLCMICRTTLWSVFVCSSVFLCVSSDSEGPQCRGAAQATAGGEDV